MSEENNKKISKKLDKFIMGAIIGGAIGSVLGLTLAPKKGKETREYLKKKSGELIEKGKGATEKFMEEHSEEVEKIKNKFIKRGRKFLSIMREKLNLKKKETNEEKPRKIPREARDENEVTF